jgi:hypothetical protein
VIALTPITDELALRLTKTEPALDVDHGSYRPFWGVHHGPLCGAESVQKGVSLSSPSKVVKGLAAEGG